MLLKIYVLNQKYIYICHSQIQWYLYLEGWKYYSKTCSVACLFQVLVHLQLFMGVKKACGRKASFIVFNSCTLLRWLCHYETYTWHVPLGSIWPQGRCECSGLESPIVRVLPVTFYANSPLHGFVMEIPNQSAYSWPENIFTCATVEVISFASYLTFLPN